MLQTTVTKRQWQGSVFFSKQRSVFANRYDCMHLTRDEGEEFMHLVNRCKAALKRFKFEEPTKEQFDALILLSALKSPADEPLRANPAEA